MNFRKNLRNISFYLFLGICLIFIGIIFFRQNRIEAVKIIPTPSPAPEVGEFTISKVTKVYDGDTIEIEGGVKVRYIGIDTAEVYPRIQCFSREAKKENEKLVLGKEAKLVKDVSETDKYGRLLRYVYIGNELINDDLVKSGFAKVMTVPPDVKFKDEFLNSENYAKDQRLGLWGKCF